MGLNIQCNLLPCRVLLDGGSYSLFFQNSEKQNGDKKQEPERPKSLALNGKDPEKAEDDAAVEENKENEKVNGHKDNGNDKKEQEMNGKENDKNKVNGHNNIDKDLPNGKEDHGKKVEIKVQNGSCRHECKFESNRKHSLKVHLRSLDEIIGQAVDHLKHRGELWRIKTELKKT